jgi:predicted alpha/beta-fold hydrolase
MIETPIRLEMERTPFRPHPLLQNAHAQTIGAFFLPRRLARLRRLSAPRLFDGAGDAKVLAHCAWQTKPDAAPAVVLVHGLEGSAESHYMLGTGEKALAAGLNLVRLNMRNCGGTEHLASTLYHAGMTEDLRQVVTELIERDGVRQIVLVGFSLGGNVALKLAGEYADDPPDELCAVAAISPSIHLKSCIDSIELRSNLLYHRRFVRSMKSRLALKARIFPDRYDTSHLRSIKSIRGFDDAYTAPLSGFRDSADYYERASALPYIASIGVPTLIIHAKDDPLIPFEPFCREPLAANANLTLLAPDHGGHVGFVAARNGEPDIFWSEHRTTQFVRLVCG